MTTAQIQSRLRAIPWKNKPVHFKYKGKPGKRLLGTVVDQVSFLFDDYKFVMQRIRYGEDQSDDGCRYAYRTGYYTWRSDGTGPVWGQYTQVLSERQQRKLIALAKAKRWPIF